MQFVIDLTLSDDEDAVVAAPPAPARAAPTTQQGALPGPSTSHPPAMPLPTAGTSSQPAGGPSGAAASQQQPGTKKKKKSIWDLMDDDNDDDDDDDDLDLGYPQNASSLGPMAGPAGGSQGPARGQGTSAGVPPQPPQRRHSSSSSSQEGGRPPHAAAPAPALARGSSAALLTQQSPPPDPPHHSQGGMRPQQQQGRDQQQQQQQPDSDDDMDGDDGDGEEEEEGNKAVRAQSGAGAGAAGGGGAARRRAPVPDPERWEELAKAHADVAALRARAEGESERDVARARKAAHSACIKKLKEQAKEQAKADKLAAKVAKAEQKAAEKEAKQMEKDVNKALSGGGSDPVKNMVALLSPRLLEVTWGPALMTSLQAAQIEYKMMGADQPLSGQYAFIRWVRRVPRQAAALVAGSQSQSQSQQDAPPAQDQGGCLEVVDIPGLTDPHQVCLALPLIMVFITPRQLVDAMPPAQAVPGAPFRILAAPGGGPGLRALRGDVGGSYPGCTLTVACVGLDKELALMERTPNSTFNAGVVRNQLLDLQLALPALRMREDLIDGGMACELVVTTTRCLAQHHKKQQADGYLESHQESNVPRNHPGLQGATQGQRALAVALGHLLPPARAVALALQHTSVPALMRVLTDPSKGLREREDALMMMDRGGARGQGTVGKTSSKAVHNFFTQADAAATCRPDTA